MLRIIVGILRYYERVQIEEICTEVTEKYNNF
jgi:hypothetical protein